MKWIRIIGGTVFLLAGTGKLLATAGFAEILKQSGAPFPHFFALAVPIVEVAGGVALLKNFQVRPVAAVLAVEMVFALVLVGAPGARGARFQTDRITIGGEAWRVPLEIILLAMMIFLAARRK